MLSGSPHLFSRLIHYDVIPALLFVLCSLRIIVPVALRALSTIWIFFVHGWLSFQSEYTLSSKHCPIKSLWGGGREGVCSSTNT